MDDTLASCLSCTRELTKGIRRGVPSGIECCLYCWRRVPVTERLKIAMAVRDRQFGGVIHELAELITRSIDQKSQEDA